MTKPSNSIKRKVAVFGLDGITFDLLQPWLDEGRLPNLARLLAAAPIPASMA
jgi:predicted AlkP superfamily phosphohydrolase/phosphomutase